MIKTLSIFAAATLAMALTVPVAARAGMPGETAASLEITGVKLAQNSDSAPTVKSGTGSTHRPVHHYRHHYRYHHHYYHHRYRSRRHYSSRHHRIRTAEEDPKASEPKAAATKGVIPKISP